MKNVDAFIELSLRIIDEYEAGRIDRFLAAEKIYKQVKQHALEGGAHPMLAKVFDLTFDILETYRSEKEDQDNWLVIISTVKNYAAGNWEPTRWIVTIMYGEYAEDRLAQSFSVMIGHQNGKTTIESASNEIKLALESSVENINENQTDERYLRNLAYLLPARIGTYGLISFSVEECLMEPYYTTNLNLSMPELK